jgi:hypothetical protein
MSDPAAPVAQPSGIPSTDLLMVVQNQKTATEVLEHIVEHPELSPEALVALLRHPNTPGSAIARLAARATESILGVMLSNLSKVGRWVAALESLLTNPAIPEIKHATIKQEIEIAKRRDADGSSKKSLLLRIKELPVGQKLALAKKGNKDVRAILIRDSNDMIALETVGSSRITDGEILSIATMRDISDKVLRYIANNRKYRQNKQMVLALLNNPRTPVGVSLGLGIPALSDRELQDLAKNRNIPAVVSRAAKSTLDRRKQGSGGGGGH